MKMKTFLLIIITIFMAASCTHRAHKGDPTKHSDNDQVSLPERNNNFAFDLLNHIPHGTDNMVVSPFSISTALAMTYTGARGTTLDEMAATMHFDTDQQRFHREYGDYLALLNKMAEGHIQLNIANSLWAQEDYDFLESFFDINKKHYDSPTFMVNFETNREQVRLDINDWVFNETHEKIKDLIAPGVFTEDTRLVLVNAIHFFGPWLKEFDPDLTRENVFHLGNHNHVMADFMIRTDTFPYFENDVMQALEIPYSGEDYSMLLLLPAEGLPLKDMEKSLDATVYAEILKNMQNKEVDVFVPRFEAETKLDLEETLMEMGMRMPFSREADFRGMTGDLDLQIDKVIHQAMIEVAEEGTEAAAATAVVMIRKTAIDTEPRTVFNANRPFMFFIKDNRHQSILFAGRIMNPGK